MVDLFSRFQFSNVSTFTTANQPAITPEEYYNPPQNVLIPPTPTPIQPPPITPVVLVPTTPTPTPTPATENILVPTATITPTTTQQETTQDVLFTPQAVTPQAAASPLNLNMNSLLVPGLLLLFLFK